MKKLIFLAIILTACKDNGPKCYECTVEFTNATFEELKCGYISANQAERITKRGYSGNLVINGGTFKKIKCKNP